MMGGMGGGGGGNSLMNAQARKVVQMHWSEDGQLFTFSTANGHL
jgi:hypothetical protein